MRMSLWQNILVYFIGITGIILLYQLLLFLSSLIVPDPGSIGRLLVHLLAIIAITAASVGMRKYLRYRYNVKRRHLHNPKLAAIPKLREIVSQYTDILRFGRSILEEAHKTLEIEDAQLTLYYDIPVGLEVTNIRLRGNSVQTSIERVREDDTDIFTENDDFLSPLTAAHSEVMTYRDRLVGMLFLGPKTTGVDYDRFDYEFVTEFASLIASVTENLMMFRRVSEANQKLFETEKLASVGQLASGIAHEIRNPLASMKMNLQGLSRRENLSARDKRRVQISLDAIDRLDQTIGELMHFAKRTQLDVSTIKIKTLLDKSIRMARAELHSKGIVTEVTVDKGVSTIQADEGRLLRAILNLLINSSQAMGKNGTIYLTAEAYGEGVEIHIRDTGPGIPKKIQRDIFNPFFTTKADGTGLGLANALKYVQEHGGELECKSDETHGAEFVLRLPPTPPAYQADPAALRVVPT